MNVNKLNPDLLRTKQHFEILDGLRGIAALTVVVFHFMEVVYTDYSKNFVGHGFLAVDFFFCLSGFVIGYAYDNRFGKMGVMEFFKSRIIRLHPLVIFGSVLGLLGFLFDPFGGHPELYGFGKIALFFLTSILLIPFPGMPERWFNLFSFNAPAWSLFWEYVANILYALILVKISRRYLLILALLAAAGIGVVGYHAGNLMGGWGKDNFWDGCARISYSFLAGLLVFRFNWIIKNRLGFIGLSALLMLPFLMPHFQWNWLIEVIVVLFYFPLLIALGAGATLTSGLKKLCVFSGKISYPLYMTHYAAIWIFASYFAAYKPGTMQLVLVITTGTLLLVGFSYLVMVFYDIPVRKYLNARRKMGN
ncbi:Peptidoglycan/LPS O-acetylase OafA/YrhL, contains acyltransferase and SGNH-hydrolase domains [Chitinophaga ginsengisegetis]|uniref:Peptidoglycan/LPS O-acetylase OafA/YrhL, contains acyltransferase and SGNH-hydrolase domains n=1 Tax=Chitinophaga ginsengisegetis TaxID=393003 RepID=A0A1T5PAS0_9BACT|nr:acyltransferase [Chitinophaga ginsengisegetis]SKD09359.1 Peptidoglycan/LPS O-acetylase OafA/YrhL, contains acyltransferase and SGNH-hydrolase domains [Chitinophaga ginsengisegetis]